MGLEQRLADDAIAALRAGDVDRKRTLRLMRAALKNATIEAGGQLDEDAVLALLDRQAKQRRETIPVYEDAGRDDLAASERAELAVIESYLPQRMPPDEIEEAVRAQIEAVGAEGLADIGKVMPPLMKALAGRADGRAVSEVVRRLLAG